MAVVPVCYSHVFLPSSPCSLTDAEAKRRAATVRAGAPMVHTRDHFRPDTKNSTKNSPTPTRVHLSPHAFPLSRQNDRNRTIANDPISSSIRSSIRSSILTSTFTVCVCVCAHSTPLPAKMATTTTRTPAALLVSARATIARLSAALRCPACNGPFGDAPVQSTVCGHTVCSDCGELASRDFGACPVADCAMPLRPVDMCEDRTVRDVAAAVAGLVQAVGKGKAKAAVAVRPAEADRGAKVDQAGHAEHVEQPAMIESEYVSPTPPPDSPAKHSSDGVCVDESDDDDSLPSEDANGGAKADSPMADADDEPMADADEDELPSDSPAINSPATTTASPTNSPAKSPSTAVAPTPICVTSAGEKAPEIFRALHNLSVTLVDGAGSDPSLAPFVLLTELDAHGDFAARTRAVHYALANNTPIADVSWAVESAAAGRLLPVEGFLARRPSSPPPATGSGGRKVFDGVAAFVDCGAGMLTSDVEAWMRAAGATIVDGDAGMTESDAIGKETRLFVHVLPDTTQEKREIGPEAVVEMCQERGVEVLQTDVAWVSDCLVSCACPPRGDFLDETCRDTMGQSMWETDE